MIAVLLCGCELIKTERTNMRTEQEIKSEFEQLCKEINAIIDTMGDCGSGPMARIAVLQDRPDLKKRWDDLMKEGKDCEEKNK